MGLAEEIIAYDEKETPKQEVDEFGIPIPPLNVPEYLVARALLVNQEVDAHGVVSLKSLHARGGEIYLGNSPIKQTQNNVYQLTRYRQSVREWEQAAFWQLLFKYLPRLNRRILHVSGDLYWDTEKAELISLEEAKERSRDE